MTKRHGKFRKKIMFLTVFCLLFTLLMPVFALAATPSDISNHWAKNTIQSWVDKGFIDGYPDGSFKPDNNISRAEFITLVNKAYGYTETSPITFSDVSPDAWYANAVAVAIAAGYINGFPDGTMRPDSPISREQAATIIMYINNLEANAGAANGFTDAAAMIWSKGAIGAVAEADIMNGYPDGSFGPQKPITRAEAVVSLDRAIQIEPVPVPVTPPALDATRNDVSNTVSGMTTAMEYKLDSGNWVAYMASEFDDLNFSGNHTLMVRYAAEGINPYGPATTLTFTTNVVSGGGGGGLHDVAVSDINVTSGIAKVGVVLTAGTLTPAGATVTYQWQIATEVDGVYADITGATANTYTPVPGDETKYIKVVTTGTGNYYGTVTSAATGAVASVDGSALKVAPVDLGTAGDYAILAKTGISTVPTSAITGDIGVSPVAATGITGFDLVLPAGGAWSTSSQVTGKVYAPDYANPTPANLTTAVGDMEAAYTEAAGRAANYTELYTGDISGKTLTAGVYKWSTDVLINTDVTLNGGADDVWIFQIAKGITQANGASIILTGGAQAKNIFWQAAETVAIGTTAHFEGIILGMKEITLNTGASINGRLLAQTAVTLDTSTVTEPAAD